MSQTRSPAAATPAVAVVPPGWWALADAAWHYPDDLPQEWRLTYFANEYSGVYLPFTAWGTQPDVTLRTWREDVQAGFGFFLGLPQDTAAALDRPRAAQQALGANLVGWVRWPAAGMGAGDLLEPGGPDEEPRRLGQALHCPAPLLTDLRAGARWLREQVAAASATLLVLPHPTGTQLAEWRELVRLLGLAELSAPQTRWLGPSA
jgi:hypothetical protein